MKTSESIAKIAEAMAAVQKGLQPALKDSDNPFFKSKYADLASVSAACKDLMASNGIAVIQSPGECADKQMTLTTRLVHKSGEWIEGTLSIPLPKFDPQAYGSALTYARRYSLAAFAGVVTDDDDGNAASRPTKDAVANDGPKNNAPITDAQFAEITGLGEQCGQDWAAFCKYYKVASVKALPASRFDDARASLATKIKKQEKEAA
jgi:hypothetical protein